MNAAFWMLMALALGIAGVLTVLDEILSEPSHPQPEALSEPESKNTERRSRGECRT
jgi:hypothetical protein